MKERKMKEHLRLNHKEENGWGDHDEIKNNRRDVRRRTRERARRTEGERTERVRERRGRAGGEGSGEERDKPAKRQLLQRPRGPLNENANHLIKGHAE